MPGTLQPMTNRKHQLDRHSLVPVIDIFAGPGGLSEGFERLEIRGIRPFDVRLSIEKDPVACATLRLRRIFSQFTRPPADLLEYVAGRIPAGEFRTIFANESEVAEQNVWNAELGKVPPTTVAKTIANRLAGSKNWVLLGGPPCQAYSIAGRSRMRGTRPDFESDERHFLYREYLRIVADHQPAVFVLENVKGLITSKLGGNRIVSKILDDLAEPDRATDSKRKGAAHYRLYALSRRQASLPWAEGGLLDGEDFILRAEEFGIPQMRHRLFIVGVRSDIHHRPAPLEYKPQVAAGDVLSDLPKLRSQLSREADSLPNWREAVSEILTQDWVHSDDSRIKPVKKIIKLALAEIENSALSAGEQYSPHFKSPRALGDWYRRLDIPLVHHETRSHMRSDLHRYAFAAAFARAHGRSPELKDFPSELRPAHKNLEAALSGGDMFNDRFRVQLEDRPSTTITSHISKDGHYYIHFDPAQCRSLTVREAARLQTFPDDYVFEGTKTQQYHQIGNAVPPLLAFDIAKIIYELLRDAGLVQLKPNSRPMNQQLKRTKRMPPARSRGLQKK